jgi:DNA polymerase I-like protein with 3'-5' exonuclease and polymerase domains/uracil-DNA glycosylase
MAAINDLPFDYDPRDFGAQCDRCSLRGSPIVPSKGYASSAELCIVAEAPGIVEEALAEPLVGPSGKETDHALLAAGARREDCFLTNICLCRPHDTSMEGHLALVAGQNRKRKKESKESILPAPVACYPRLMFELQGAKALLLMGKFARSTFYPKERGESKLMASRGFPSWAEVKPAGTAEQLAALNDGARGAAEITGRAVRCLATVHPAYALRMGRWLPVFESDVDKAVRTARDQLRWTEPEMLFWPTPEQFENFLAEIDASRQPVAYDTETRYGLDWSHPRALRLFGIGTAKRVVCVPFQSVEEHPAVVYTSAQLRRFGEIIVNWFARPGSVVGHNSRKFDHLVCEHSEYLPGWRMVRREFDTVLAHHGAWSELPHTLEFMSAQYTDAPAHKAVDHGKWHEVGDREYHRYNMRDVAITAICAGALAQDKKLIEQKVVFAGDGKLSDFCRGMEETGIWVDAKACSDQSAALAHEMEDARRDVHGMLVGISKLDGGEKLGKELKAGWEFNPGSPPQIGTLLYDLLDITPMPAEQGGFTETGRPSVEKPILFQLCDRGVPQVVEDLIQRIIDYREAHKLRSTYCDPLMPGSKRQSSGDIRMSKDGRLLVVWNPHVVVSGRLSSSPNVMNIRESMRAILAADPRRGHAFACCDKSQLEARIVAMLAGQQNQIDAFLAGADIHKVNAVDLFELPGVDMVTPEERQFTKTFVYAAQYLAGLDKIVQMIRVFRDRNGKRPYRLFSKTDGEACYERLWRSRHAILDFHAKNRQLQQTVGYLADALDGRRRYFMDGASGENIKEELANFVIQSSAAADVNRATFRLLEAFPFGFDGPGTGIIHQCHDSIIIECKEEHVVAVGKRMITIMDSYLDKMPLPVELKVGKNYRDLKKVKD